MANETRGAFLKREATQYKTTMDMSQMERQCLDDWVKDGNSVYDNPWCIADEQGRPMDYISAIRVVDDLKPVNDRIDQLD
jgi:hypothetical protein